MNTLMDLRAGLVGGITLVIQSRVGKWALRKQPVITCMSKNHWDRSRIDFMLYTEKLQALNSLSRLPPLFRSNGK